MRSHVTFWIKPCVQIIFIRNYLEHCRHNTFDRLNASLFALLSHVQRYRWWCGFIAHGVSSAEVYSFLSVIFSNWVIKWYRYHGLASNFLILMHVLTQSLGDTRISASLAITVTSRGRGDCNASSMGRILATHSGGCVTSGPSSDPQFGRRHFGWPQLV